MKFTYATALLSVVLSVQAVAVPASAPPKNPDIYSIVNIYDDVKQGGQAGEVRIYDDGCQNVPEGWAGRTSSYALPRGMTCRFYSTADCAGKDFGQFYTKDNIGAKNDDKLMSMKCKWIGWSLIG